jgi:hypothetical protein
VNSAILGNRLFTGSCCHEHLVVRLARLVQLVSHVVDILTRRTDPYIPLGLHAPMHAPPTKEVPSESGMLAVKVEENNVQKAKVYTALALEHDPSLIHAAFNTKTLLDTELLLMQAFDCQLLLFSVHSELGLLLQDMMRHSSLALRRVAFEERIDVEGHPEISQYAWNVACDVYCSPACLMESPGTIALACVVLAAKLLQVCSSPVLLHICCCHFVV